MARLRVAFVSATLRWTFRSSPNPWVLAEVQRALQAEDKASIPGLCQELGTGSSDGGGVKDEDDASSVEVTVVRVALPSAAEREQVRTSLSCGGALYTGVLVDVVFVRASIYHMFTTTECVSCTS